MLNSMYRTVICIIAFLVAFLITQIFYSNNIYAQTTTASKCPNGSNAPEGDVDLCPESTWNIKCYNTADSIKDSISEPVEVSCPDSLSDKKFDVSCYKLRTRNKDGVVTINSVLTPCLNKKNVWSLACYNSNDVKSECPDNLWEYASQSKCFKLKSGETPRLINCPADSGVNPDDDSDPTPQDIPVVEPVKVDLDVPDSDQDGIAEQVRNVYKLLIAGVGIISLIMLIIAGLQYMTSRDNPQAVQAAKSKVYNVFIAIFCFVFLTAFLEWLIGGIIT